MTTTRDEYEPWLRDYLRKRFPELEPAMLAAINAYDSIRAGQRINHDLLKPILEAASSSRRPLYENATIFMSKLTSKYAEACEAVESMSHDTRNHVRFNAILCLSKSTPRELTLKLTRQGLRGKSATVRQKAADWSGRLEIGELVPDLEMAAAQEKNAKAKATIEFELKLLRDGYILESGSDEGYTVTTRTQHGVGSRWVQRVEFESRGLQAIIAELAQPRW